MTTMLPNIKQINYLNETCTRFQDPKAIQNFMIQIGKNNFKMYRTGWSWHSLWVTCGSHSSLMQLVQDAWKDDHVLLQNILAQTTSASNGFPNMQCFLALLREADGCTLSGIKLRLASVVSWSLSRSSTNWPHVIQTADMITPWAI
jgi:hypothetical protein